MQAVFEGEEDYHKVSELIERVGDKLKAAKNYINPPLVSYEKETPGDESKDVETNGGRRTASGHVWHGKK